MKQKTQLYQSTPLLSAGNKECKKKKSMNPGDEQVSSRDNPCSLQLCKFEIFSKYILKVMKEIQLLCYH